MKRIMEGIGRQFATGVGLITSAGKHGPNVMAAEWTLHISYEPMLIAIFIHKGEATYDNIMETWEFGVNMSSDGQADLVNIAGGYSKKEIDKVNVGDLFKLYPGRYIKAPMINGCVINAECKVVKKYNIGDHTAVIGRVVHATYDRAKSPLIYNRGMYRTLGRKLSGKRRQISVGKGIFTELQRMNKNAFTLRCIAALIRNQKGERLFVKRDPKVWHGRWMVPWFAVERGRDHSAMLKKHLTQAGLNVKVGKIAGMDRVIFKHNSKKLRANFVIYSCTTGKSSHSSKYFSDLKWSRTVPTNLILKGLINFK